MANSNARTNTNTNKNKKNQYRLFSKGVVPPKNDLQVGMDAPMFLIIMVLLVFGIIMMFSAGYAWAIDKGLEGSYYAERQLGMAGIGLVGMLIISVLDYHLWQKEVIIWLAYFGGLGLLLMCFVPGVMSPHNDSRRWIKIAGIEFQPSEMAKLALILVVAYMISLNYDSMKSFVKGILPIGIVLGIYALVMVKQPHFSGTIIMVGLCISMLFIGGASKRYIVGLVLLAVAAIGALMLYYVITDQFTYMTARFNSWLHPFDEAYADDTWQTRNSLIAIGSGGIFGLGLGNSRQKFLYLPESKNDFVFAVVCEELGFIGAVLVIILFLMFVARGFTIAAKAVDKSGMLIACGITVQIGLQALLNMAVVTNTIPNTGISLPFFSYGGTALIMQLWEVGILLNISRHVVVSDEDYKRAKGGMSLFARLFSKAS